MTMSDCDRELNAHFYSVASLKYYAPDTWYVTLSWHWVEQSKLYPVSLSSKREAAN